MPRVEPSVEAPVPNASDSVRDLMVEVGAAVAEPAVAQEAAVHTPIHPLRARRSRVFHQLPSDV